MRTGIACFAVAALSPLPSATARPRCFESLAGTCLKHEERTPAACAVSLAEAPELGLDAAARRAIQAAFGAAGFGAGPPDGGFGAKTRRAIAAWRKANGRSPSGFLGSGDAAALRAPSTGAARPAKPAPWRAPLRSGPQEGAVLRAEAHSGRILLTLWIVVASEAEAILRLRIGPRVDDASDFFDQSGRFDPRKMFRRRLTSGARGGLSRDERVVSGRQPAVRIWTTGLFVRGETLFSPE